MHLSFLTPEYPHVKTTSSGGLGTSIFTSARYLMGEGVKVTILVYGQECDEFFEDEGIHIYKIKNIKVQGISWLLTRIKIQILLRRISAKNRISLLEVADWTGISAWIRTEFPIVMRLHGSDTFFCHLDQRKVSFWNRLQEKAAFKKANAIVAVSDFVGHISNDLFQLKRTYSVIHNGINTDVFTASNSFTPDRVILYFGTLIRKKGVLEIPGIFNEIVKINPNVQLLLIGSDSFDVHTGSISTWKLMQDKFSDEALEKVQYIGKVPYVQIQQYISKVSVCIFPSFAEAFPISWLEAMAMGKAIVASNVGWANEMIKDGKEGYLVCPRDHIDFANKISKILDNPSLRLSLGNSARQKVIENFSSNKIGEKNVEFYHKIISQ
jgi:glycosyltransferase involved in cell wall biosynthesis